MWKFLRFGLSKRRAPESPVTVPPVVHGFSAPQHTAKRRELVRVVLRDTLRKHGIPTDWIGFEITPLGNSVEGDAHLVHLVVLKWHEHLMDFAPVLQEQLWLGLGRFSPDVDRTQFIFGWKFSPDCACPVDAMPEPAFWSERKSARVAVPSSASRKFDLPTSEYDHRSSGFAPTQPGEMG